MARMENGGIELRREAGRSDSFGIALFPNIFHLGVAVGEVPFFFFYVLEIYTFCCRDSLHYFLCNFVINDSPYYFSLFY